jgi:hypothetical protein
MFNESGQINEWILSEQINQMETTWKTIRAHNMQSICTGQDTYKIRDKK